MNKNVTRGFEQLPGIVGVDTKRKERPFEFTYPAYPRWREVIQNGLACTGRDSLEFPPVFIDIDLLGVLVNHQGALRRVPVFACPP